jgi:transcriptional regulator with XRE-family HTH domain
MDENLAAVLGKRIKELVGDRKYSAIARQIGVKPNTFWGYLNGLTMPSFKILLKLAEHFDVSVDWLLKGQESLLPKNSLEMDVLSSIRRITDRRVAEQAATYVHFLAGERDKPGSELHEVYEKIIEANGLDTLGKRLAHIRETELGMSKKEFADELGLSVDELNEIESDIARPRALTLMAYHSKFNGICPLDILLSGKSETPGN